MKAVKKYLNKPIIEIDSNIYLTLIIIFTPVLNFLSGVNIDIASPSMPAIASYFNASITMTKNTISVTLLGWALGALFFGILIDSIGRKKVLICGLLFYVISSFFAPWCHSIQQLMLVRCMQGLTIAAISIGSRTLVIDNITGHRYAIAILYTSVGYGLGIIIGPFIGGILQHYIGWQANFIALTIISISLLFILLIFITESIPTRQPLMINNIISRCISILKHKKFISGVIISSLMQIQLMIYPTLAPFIVEDLLHRSALIYGNTALIVAASYLIGTLIGRFMLKYISPKEVCYYGYAVLLLGLLFFYFFVLFSQLDLLTLMLPIILICISVGLIFPNILGANLKQFPDSAGMSLAIQASLLLLITSVGMFIISHIHIVYLSQVALIFFILILLELLIFFFYYRNIFEQVS